MEKGSDLLSNIKGAPARARSLLSADFISLMPVVWDVVAASAPPGGISASYSSWFGLTFNSRMQPRWQLDLTTAPISLVVSTREAWQAPKRGRRAFVAHEIRHDTSSSLAVIAPTAISSIWSVRFRPTGCTSKVMSSNPRQPLPCSQVRPSQRYDLK